MTTEVPYYLDPDYLGYRSFNPDGTPKWDQASLEQIRNYVPPGNGATYMEDAEAMGDFQPDVVSATFWQTPEVSPNIDFDVHQGREGNWWEPVATATASGETDLAGETTTERSWMEYEAPGVITRAFEAAAADEAAWPQFGREVDVPTFGGAYESPQTNLEPQYFGVPGTEGPTVLDFGIMNSGPLAGGVTYPGDPEYWGAYPGAHGELNQSVPVERTGFSWPDLSIPGFEMPSGRDILGTVFPGAAVIGDAGEAVKEKVDEGFDFMQMMMLMLILKD